VLRLTNDVLVTDISKYLDEWFNDCITVNHPGWNLRVKSCVVSAGEISVSVVLLYHNSEQRACVVTDAVSTNFDVHDVADEIVQWAMDEIEETYASLCLVENDSIIATDYRDREQIAARVTSAIDAWHDKIRQTVEAFKMSEEYSDDCLTVNTVSNVDFDDNVQSTITVMIRARYKVGNRPDGKDVNKFSMDCDGLVDMSEVRAFLEENRGLIDSELTKFYKTNHFDAHSKMRGYDSDKRAETKKSVETPRTKAAQQRIDDQQRAQIRKAIKKVLSR